MSGVHRLEHVESLASADLANDDPIRADPESVPDQVPNGDLSSPLDVRRPSLERHDVRSVQAKLGSVLDRDQSLVIRDERRQDPEEGRLAAAGSAAHHQVRPSTHTRRKEPQAPRPDAALANDVLAGQRDWGERTDREHGAAERKGRNDRVNPRERRNRNAPGAATGRNLEPDA
jgi:hypothetical protein